MDNTYHLFTTKTGYPAAVICKSFEGGSDFVVNYWCGFVGLPVHVREDFLEDHLKIGFSYFGEALPSIKGSASVDTQELCCWVGLDINGTDLSVILKAMFKNIKPKKDRLSVIQYCEDLASECQLALLCL